MSELACIHGQRVILKSIVYYGLFAVNNAGYNIEL